MGKIHDTYERKGKMQDLTAVPAIIPLAGKKRLSKSPIKVIAPPGNPTPTPKPAESVQIDPHLVAYHDPTGVEAEIFKILRTNILFPKKGRPPRTLMVTSAVPGDGKSFVAANLAISITHGIEEHVLLMDCDLRRPSLHLRFGFDDKVPGLSDYLNRTKPLGSLLQKTVVDKLTLLPSGPVPPNPSELLSSQAMNKLLVETRSRYEDRYVIVDSPPPQLTAETAVLANYIDGIILVVKYGVTPKDRIQNLLETLGREKVIGVVMNGYRVPTTERYGYGKYKKYKKY